jgi:hypothetical protein
MVWGRVLLALEAHLKTGKVALASLEWVPRV